MDADLDRMPREQLIAEAWQSRQGIRARRDSSLHELCWHHPARWGLLLEKSDPLPVMLEWAPFLQACIKYRQSLDEQAPAAQRSGTAHER